MATAQTDFLNTYSKYAEGVSYQTGIPSDFILGQWALETGWGQKFAGAFNVGNIQGAAKQPYNYNSLQAGVNAYGQTLSNLRYSEARTATTPEEFGTALKSSGYASDPDYASKIAATIKSITSLRGSDSDTEGGGMFNFSNLNPLEFLKSKGLDVVFIVVGGSLLAFLLIQASKGQIAQAVVSGVE